MEAMILPPPISAGWIYFALAIVIINILLLPFRRRGGYRPTRKIDYGQFPIKYRSPVIDPAPRVLYPINDVLYPINNANDLAYVWKLAGRANNPDAVRSHLLVIAERLDVDPNDLINEYSHTNTKIDPEHDPIPLDTRLSEKREWN